MQEATVILALDGRELVAGRMTGIGRFLLGVLDEIARSRPHLTTVVLAGPEAPVPGWASHIHLHRVPERTTLCWDQALLPRALRQVGACTFFSPYYKAPLLAPCPTVVTIHDVIPFDFPAYARGLWRPYAAALRSWAALLARRATAVITDSAYSKEGVLAVLGAAPERVHVIPIGVGQEFQPDVPRPVKAAAMARYGIREPYLLAVGNFLPHKNLPRLVEAYQALPATLRQRVTLVLAGTPTRHGPARSVSPASLACPGVHAPGFIAAEHLPSLYAGAAALVCPSLAEGFGLPVLEAMACGTPVVCARAGALPEVAGEAALYVDPLDVTSIAEGIEQVLTDEELRARLAAQGLTRARDFDARRTSVRLVDLLEAIARTGKVG
jgi:glycosyltransferase involved in cell wall biosynthesis